MQESWATIRDGLVGPAGKISLGGKVQLNLKKKINPSDIHCGTVSSMYYDACKGQSFAPPRVFFLSTKNVILNCT